MLNKMKITLASAIVAAAMVSGAANAATANADATVQILTPVTVTKTADLDFGLIATSGAGTVVVNEVSAAKSCSGAVTCVGAAGVLGSFNVSSASGQVISVSVGNATLALAGQPSMPASLRLAGTGVSTVPTGNAGSYTSGAAAKAVNVGGTLTVGAAQGAGTYSGQFTLTADYQ
jgi:Mat/Ecp fimbriae major subunit